METYPNRMPIFRNFIGVKGKKIMLGEYYAVDKTGTGV